VTEEAIGQIYAEGALINEECKRDCMYAKRPVAGPEYKHCSTLNGLSSDAAVRVGPILTEFLRTMNWSLVLVWFRFKQVRTYKFSHVILAPKNS
jgi:hypothetical protein